MQRKKGLLVAMMLFSVKVFALSQAETTLWSGYQDAVHNDPVFMQQKATLQEAEQSVPEARSYLFPQLLMNAQLANTYQNAAPFGSNNFNSNNYGINLSQTIFNMSQFNALKQAKVSVQAAAALFSAQTQDLIVRYMRAYLAVLQARDLLRYTQSQADFAHQFYGMTQKRYDLRFATITEIDQAKQQYQLFRAQTITAKITYDQSLQNLRNITAMHYAGLKGFQSHFPVLHLSSENIDQWVALAKKQNLFLRAAVLDMLAAKSQIDVKKSDFLPTVSGTSNYSDNNQLSTPGPSAVLEKVRSTEVGLNLSWNIVQGGLTIAQTRKATSAYERAVDLMQQKYLETITNTQNAYIGVTEGANSVFASKLAMQEGLSALQHTRSGFSAGVQSIFDLLQTQNRLFESERQYVQNFYQYILNTILLKQAVGTLSPQDVFLLNKQVSKK